MRGHKVCSIKNNHVIDIEANQSLLRGGQRIPFSDLRRAAKTVADEAGKRNGVVSLGFVTEKEIRRLNAKYRKKNRVTDVLSFSDGEAGALGEILICYPQADRQAKIAGHSKRKEVLFLFIHGLLHLFGFDHERKADAVRMFSLQTRILNRLNHL